MPFPVGKGVALRFGVYTGEGPAYRETDRFGTLSPAICPAQGKGTYCPKGANLAAGQDTFVPRAYPRREGGVFFAKGKAGECVRESRQEE